MNVILVTSSTNKSGGSRQALYLAQGLRDAGHRVLFIAPAGSRLRSLDQGLDWVELPESFLAAGRRIQDAAAPWLAAGEKVVVHAFHNQAVKVAAVFGSWWRLKGLGMACAAHRGVIFKPGNPLPYLLPGIRAFIVNSRACADVLPLYWRKKRAHVVHNCIPPERLVPSRSAADVFAEMGCAPDQPVIGCVTNNSANKGVEVLLKAFARLERPQSLLVLVGVQAELWESLCADLGVSERVRLVARTENVADYLQVFTAFALPSFSESLPNTLLEAMSLGLPAVASRVGGVPELISEVDLLVSPGDDAALAAALERLLGDAERRKACAERNKEFSKNFAPELRLNRILEIYRAILAE